MTAVYQEALDDVYQDILAMGALVEEALRKNNRALLERNAELAQEVAKGDKQIDAWEDRIEEQFVRLLALNQPVADDLRFILTGIRVNDELERMGDHIRNISRRVVHLVEFEKIGVSDRINTLIEETEAIVGGALEVLRNRSRDGVDEVRSRDRVVDHLCNELNAEISDLMRRNPDNVDQGVLWIAVLRNFERVADIAGNIARDILLMVDGIFSKHSN